MEVISSFREYEYLRHIITILFENTGVWEKRMVRQPVLVMIYVRLVTLSHVCIY